MSGVPYAAMLGERDPQAVIAETPGRLARVLDRVPASQADAPTTPGKWSLREIMAHMADCEIAWSWRLRMAYELERAQMQPFEQDAWAKMYAQYTLEAAKATFTALRAWNVAFVAGLSEAGKRKPIFHPVRGEETLWTLVQIMAGHDLHHLATLETQFPGLGER
jgi:uncharacterized damage-inducible protein DinB